MATVNQLVRIPIDEDVYALNAACASAVALYAFKEKLNPH
jgi:tRNA G18 (ribose-2'-O)-methylase SpoU